MIYDIAILGAGPAGVAAGVYASRKKLKTVFITDTWGGQSVVSDGIENWIGTVKIPGAQLAIDLETHLRAYAEGVVDIHAGEFVQTVTKSGNGAFNVTTDKGSYEAKTVLVTTGSHRRKLDIPGADTFENKGITYCASCDGPLFADQDVVVVGGGNAGFETAAQLSAYCRSVTLITRSEFRADPVTVEKVLAHKNVKAFAHAGPVEIKGDKFVSSIIYENTETKEKTELQTTGIFVEIGLLPSTEFLKEVVSLNQYSQIPIEPRTQATQTPGIWAAGDCTDTLYHQNNIAAGDAVRALEDIYMHLHTK